MKCFILKNRPYKWCLMIVSESNNKKQPFDISYLGFHSKSEALSFYSQHQQFYKVVYASLYKRTNIIVKVFNKVLDKLSEPISF